MTQETHETRAEEVARVRSYLSSQAMRRTPAQLVEALQEAHRQLLTVTASIPDALFHTRPDEGEWSTADVLAHVCSIAAFDERSIIGVIEHGESPTTVKDTLELAPTDVTRESLLTTIQAHRERLIAVVLQAEPNAHLDLLWEHREFGSMSWREWLLFARVHTLDHVRQIQAIAAALSSSHPSETGEQ